VAESWVSITGVAMLASRPPNLQCSNERSWARREGTPTSAVAADDAPAWG
jgi:hypothetical protein